MKKIRGFTLIELIVVIAIIGILATILVPMMMAYINDSRIAKMNSNAKEIHNAAQLAINDCQLAGDTIAPNCIYTGSGDGIGHPDGGGDDCDLTDYLGKNFGGYFLFMTDSQGYGCTYALWSEVPIPASSAGQLTMEEVEATINTSLPRGCQPLKGDDSGSGAGAGSGSGG